MAMMDYIQSTTAVVNRKEPRPIAPRPPPTATASVPPAQQEYSDSTTKEIVNYEPEDPLLSEDFTQDLNFDVGSMLNEIEQNVAISQINTANNVSTTMQCQTKKRSSPYIPIFNNCKIGSIGNIHFTYASTVRI